MMACGNHDTDRRAPPPPPPPAPKLSLTSDAGGPRGPSPIAIGMGFRSALALLDDGTVRAWGNGQFGMLGTGKGSDAATPIVVPGVADALALEVGNSMPIACARLRSGAWSCWGDGELLPSGTPGVREPAVEPALDGMRVIRLGWLVWLRDPRRRPRRVLGQRSADGRALEGKAARRRPRASQAMRSASRLAARTSASSRRTVRSGAGARTTGHQTSATTDQPAENRVVSGPAAHSRNRRRD